MRSNQNRCACGMPLHYSSKESRELVENQIAEHGENVKVHVGSSVYSVQRHYLALHGIKGNDLDRLAREGIVRRVFEQ